MKFSPWKKKFSNFHIFLYMFFNKVSKNKVDSEQIVYNLLFSVVNNTNSICIFYMFYM